MRTTTFVNAGGLDTDASGMGAQTKQGYRLTQEHYAYIYGVHPNTIHRWQKRLLPLDDPKMLLFVVLNNPYCPMSLKLKGYEAIMADFRALAGE
jgi:hypothetical protein